MKTMIGFAVLFAGFTAAAAYATCDYTSNGACCTEWSPQGQCLEEVDCSSCSAPTPSEPAPSEPLPDDPADPFFPHCGDMGAC